MEFIVDNKFGIIYNIIMEAFDIVLDTNVVFSGLYSNKGASFQLLSMVGKNVFNIHLSVPLVLEYEEQLKAKRKKLGLTLNDVDDVIDYLCCAGICYNEVNVFWRPCLKDPDDDMILELAIHAKADYIITHNVKDFQKVKGFRINALKPNDFLHILRREELL